MKRKTENERTEPESEEQKRKSFYRKCRTLLLIRINIPGYRFKLIEKKKIKDQAEKWKQKKDTEFIQDFVCLPERHSPIKIRFEKNIYF